MQFLCDLERINRGWRKFALHRIGLKTLLKKDFCRCHGELGNRELRLQSLNSLVI